MNITTCKQHNLDNQYGLNLYATVNLSYFLFISQSDDCIVVGDRGAKIHVLKLSTRKYILHHTQPSQSSTRYGYGIMSRDHKSLR